MKQVPLGKKEFFLPEHMNHLPVTNLRKLLDLYKCVWLNLLLFFHIACRVEKQMLEKETDTIVARKRGIS